MLLEEATAYALDPINEPLTAHDRPRATEENTIEGHQTYPNDLTTREAEVLRLIAAGKSNQEIACEPVLSLRTVERHISNFYEKIVAHGKAARVFASTFATKHGLTAG
jgi:DNA-binding NarL/FixJ family response regulator